MTAPDRNPFDPADPFDAMAENFRIQVVHMLLDANKAAIFRDLETHRKIEAFMCGALTGVVGCVLASVTPEGRDEVMKYITQYIPIARENAEDIAASLVAS